MLLVIVGPTGVGKTKLALALAKAYQAVIVNADAMQVYKGLDIGTAKVTAEEKGEIPHLLFDICDVNEEYNVFTYQGDLRQVLTDYQGQNIIIVGGTGLYIKAGLYDYQFSPLINEENYEQMTDEELYQKAQAKDPQLKIHPHNRLRLVNFLKQNNVQQGTKPLYDFKMIGLTTSREQLYNQINNRVEQMITNGLITEAKYYYDHQIYTKPLINGIGYKELYKYFAGELTQEEAITLIKQNSRHYAKRQYTWFNNQFNVKWFDVNFADFHETITEVIKYLKKEG